MNFHMAFKHFAITFSLMQCVSKKRGNWLKVTLSTNSTNPISQYINKEIIMFHFIQDMSTITASV